VNAPIGARSATGRQHSGLGWLPWLLLLLLAVVIAVVVVVVINVSNDDSDDSAARQEPSGVEFLVAA
jgi:uncharacterized protein YpmS